LTVQPLQRREKPDFHRFLKVIRRQGGRQYVPFFELVMDSGVFAPLSGLEPPKGLNFMPNSPVFEESFRYYLRCCAAMGFDHGTINMAGWSGFPSVRHGVPGTNRSFALADDCLVQSEDDTARLRWPSAKNIQVEVMERVARQAPEGLGVMTGGDAVFQTMELMLGVNGLSIMLYENPDLFGHIADRIGSSLVEAYDLVASLPFIRGVQISGDMGYKTSTVVAPAALRKYVLPWHKKMVQAVHKHGKIAILHSCGNLAEIMDDILDCGYEAKHSFEDTLQPGLFDLHRRYGRRICLIGGIDVDFLTRADEPAIRQRVRQTIDFMAPGGGYVLGSGNSIPEYVPIANFRAMLDEGLKYGRM
jgi:uroporphyrinogen decarboxylase